MKDLLVVLCIAFVGLVYLVRDHDQTQVADVADIHALSVTADKTEASKAAMKDFMQAQPLPTIAELRQLKEKINQIQVMEASKSITGHADLKPLSKEATETMTEDELKAYKILAFGFLGFILFVVYGVFRKMNR